MILHPGYKKQWIERNLLAEHASRVFATFMDLFERDYSKVDVWPIQQQERERAAPTTLAGDDFYDQPEDSAQKDELAAYFLDRSCRSKTLSSGGGTRRKISPGYPRWPSTS